MIVTAPVMMCSRARGWVEKVGKRYTRPVYALWYEGKRALTPILYFMRSVSMACGASIRSVIKCKFRMIQLYDLSSGLGGEHIDTRSRIRI